MKKALSFLSGALMGGLVGTTLALLLTPASGDDLRAQIQERVEALQLEVKEAASARRADLERQLSAMRAPTPPEESAPES